MSKLRERPHGRLRSASRGRRPFASELNVTPLVDVVLVLLIIFMVVTPYLQQGVPIELPRADHADRGDPADAPLVVTVRNDGSLWLARERLSRDALLQRVRGELAQRPGRQLLLRGDRRTRYGKVEEVLGWLRSAGAPGVELATLPDESG